MRMFPDIKSPEDLLNRIPLANPTIGNTLVSSYVCTPFDSAPGSAGVFKINPEVYTCLPTWNWNQVFTFYQKGELRSDPTTGKTTKTTGHANSYVKGFNDGMVNTIMGLSSAHGASASSGQ